MRVPGIFNTMLAFEEKSAEDHAPVERSQEASHIDGLKLPTMVMLQEVFFLSATGALSTAKKSDSRGTEISLRTVSISRSLGFPML